MHRGNEWWQECPLWLGNSDVLTAFDFARPQLALEAMQVLGAHPFLIAAILAEMVGLSARISFEGLELEIPFNKSIRQEGVESSK